MKVDEFVEFACKVVPHVGMREALIEQARIDNLAFAWEMLARWLAAEPGAKADIEAFFEPMVDSEQTPAEYVEELASCPNECKICGARCVSGEITHGRGCEDGGGTEACTECS